MMMRVKLVIIRMMAGRKVRPVSSSRVCIDSDHCMPPPAAGVLVSAGRDWASARGGIAANSSNAKRRKLFFIAAGEGAFQPLREIGCGRRASNSVVCNS